MSQRTKSFKLQFTVMYFYTHYELISIQQNTFKTLSQGPVKINVLIEKSQYAEKSVHYNADCYYIYIFILHYLYFKKMIDFCLFYIIYVFEWKKFSILLSLCIVSSALSKDAIVILNHLYKQGPFVTGKIGVVLFLSSIVLQM